MHKSFGGLLTSGLEAAGVDHARNEFLDARVINEVGKGKSLAAQKEILDLLQVALGEEITRQGVNAGLGRSPRERFGSGKLTRALNDFFNTMEELSASPFEPAIKQELFHKIQTLTKRFNEAGQSLEQIEAELSETVERSVEEVNRFWPKFTRPTLRFAVLNFWIKAKPFLTGTRGRRFWRASPDTSISRPKLK